MFEKYLLVDGSARLEQPGDDRTVAVDVRIAYYRGLGLSMVEDVSVAIDGEVIPRRDTQFSIHGHCYRLDELATAVEDRWGLREAATITLVSRDPVSPGEHLFELTERLRISYMPYPAVTHAAKRMRIAD
jgi:Domain of unknown function (DUF6379)